MLVVYMLVVVNNYLQVNFASDEMVKNIQNVISRFKKNSPRLTHIFYVLIDDIPFELDDYQMNLKKIYTSYVFFLKAKAEAKSVPLINQQ